MPAPHGNGARCFLLHNDLGELPRLHAWIEELSRSLGLAPDIAFAVDLCLQEAVGNVIAYAFSDGASHEISVSVVRAEGRVIVEVEDDGRPFDPLGIPPRETTGRLEDVQIGGLGIHLIRQFASDMRYERVDGRNRLTMAIGPEPSA